MPAQSENELHAIRTLHRKIRLPFRLLAAIKRDEMRWSRSELLQVLRTVASQTARKLTGLASLHTDAASRKKMASSETGRISSF
jgi:hypothetical protein